MLSTLQKREVFHLAFLRALARSLSTSSFVLKGGSNLRFFFGSVRYSEDMDLDAQEIAVHALRDRVMSILASSSFGDTLRTYGIDRVAPPDIAHAKQTETVQRFKVHLLTSAGEDLFTKVEFSRRGFDSPSRAEPVSAEILAAYRMPPLIVPHYTAEAAVRQKFRALLSRPQPQARDIFDLFILSTRAGIGRQGPGLLSDDEVAAARGRIYSVDYRQYRDTVIGYLTAEDQRSHGSPELWDEMRLRVVSLLEGEREDAG